MDFEQAYKKAIESEQYSDDIGHLVHGFRMYGPQESAQWQVGFYQASSDTVTVFTVTEDRVVREEPDEAFKKEGAIPELPFETIAHTALGAVQKAESMLKEQHVGHPVMKTMCVIQTINQPVFNITVITQTFNMFNVRLDTQTLDVLTQTFDSILALRKDGNEQ